MVLTVPSSAGQTFGQRDQQWALYQARRAVSNSSIRRFVYGYKRNGTWFYTFVPVGSPEHFRHVSGRGKRMGTRS